MTTIATPCTDRLSQCRCSLDEHPIDVAHHCRDFDHVSKGECGGMWLDHPTDESKVLVVRYPVAAAEMHGAPQPTEPVEEPRYHDPIFRAPRGGIQFMPPYVIEPDA